MPTPPPASEYEKEIRALYRERNERTFSQSPQSSKTSRPVPRWLAFVLLLALMAAVSLATSIGVYGWLLPLGPLSPSGQIVSTTVAQPELGDDFLKQLAGSSATVFAARTPRAGVALAEQSYLSSEALGQALVLSSDGWLVTTQLVVAEAEADYVVVAADGRVYPVVAVALDPVAPLAYLKIDARGLTATPFVNLSDLAVNDPVIVIAQESQGAGRSWFLRYMANLSARTPPATRTDLPVGSESLPDRFLLDQALPALARGAPVIDLQGRVVGLVADYSGTLRGVVPLVNMSSVIDKIFSQSSAARPVLGVTYVQSSWLVTSSAQDLPGAVLAAGTRRAAVLTPGPASRAGLKEGDRIVAIDSERLGGFSLSLALQRFRPQATIELTIERGGQEQKLNVTLGEVTGESWQAPAE